MEAVSLQVQGHCLELPTVANRCQGGSYLEPGNLVARGAERPETTTIDRTGSLLCGTRVSVEHLVKFRYSREGKEGVKQ